jgi:hypothetical protein
MWSTILSAKFEVESVLQKGDVGLNGSSDSLKCIAWKGRVIVVGFAGGEIEKVGLHPSGESI